MTLFARASKHGMAAHARRQASRLLGSDSGIAAVETALLLPVFLLFIFGVVEAGRAAYTKAVLTFAVQEGTRYAMVDPDAGTTQVETRIRSKFQMIDPAYIQTLNVSEVTNADLTKTLDIQIAYQFKTLLPVHFSDITISASAQLIRE